MTQNNKHNNKHLGHGIIKWMVLCFFAVIAASPTFSQKGKKVVDDRIYLEHADNVTFDQFVRPDVQILKGNVRFSYQGDRLTCDSAFFNQRANTFEAFGHVKLSRVDGIGLTCARLYYYGQSRQTKARQNVVLTQPHRSLHCDSLDYNENTGLANYFGGRGRLVADGTTVEADLGNYNTNTKDAHFTGDVVMTSPKYNIKTPSLHYNTETQIARVEGASVIRSKKGDVVHTNDGTYDMHSDHMELHGRSTVTSPDRDIEGDELTYNSTSGDGEGHGNVKLFDKKNDRTITGENVWYNSNTGESEGVGNVKVHDRKNQRDISGEHLKYNSQTKEGLGRGNVVYIDHKNKNAFEADTLDYTECAAIAYGRAIAKDFSDGDTLFVHADTVRMRAWNLDTDSVYRKIYGINNVRAYRTDVQAVAGLMIGNSQDSCMTLYRNPIVWNGSRQLLGDSIKVYMQDRKMREAHVFGNALSVELMNDQTHYNQVSSKTMHGYFVDGKIQWGECVGNVLSVYYPVDDKDSTIILCNYLETDTLRFYFTADRKLKKIWASKSNGNSYPLHMVPANKERLPGFAWYDYVRPLNQYDLFRRVGKGDTKKQYLMRRVTLPEQQLLESRKKQNEVP